MRRLPFAALGLALLAWLGPFAAELIGAELVEGRLIYREGRSPSGAQISARVGAGDLLMEGDALPCASCHGPDGRGRAEGGIRPPDITWQRLLTAYGQEVNGRRYPAYDAASVARAIREGRDPAGNRLDPAMPRFALSSRDMDSLLGYLQQLEKEHDPGIAEDSLRLGSLLPLSGPLADLGRTLGGVLEGAVATINANGGIHGRRLQLLLADAGPDRDSALRGLRRLLDQEQVFGLLTSLAPALDGELDAELQRRGVPLIGALPLGASPSGPLVFQPLPGLGEQLLALARYAADGLQLGAQESWLVYPQNDAALAQRLARRLGGEGWSRLRLHPYGPGLDLTPAGVAPHSVFYLGGGAPFSQLVGDFQREGEAPYLFAVAGQVAGSTGELPTAFDGQLFLSFPFVPGDWTAAGTAGLQAARQLRGLDGRHALLQVSAYCSVQLLAEGLKRSGRNLSREGLVQALEGIDGFATGLTPPLGFGPGRRVGSSGAHIVKVELPQRRFHGVGPYVRLEAPL
ncbi:cytochrome c/ABC transporter substrate-binding protein [Pseudomonas citronellolis]|uniref:cytochrome c/ABC transporter substrate-binding protein n=1 Tax=Pseudomonas citronellolis TaxID=53408 RepID=UPI0023E3F105|nr:ABC transporter substrate-binding protein [Pseudomonas citronellolis]MDF3935213.1 ABC transporter substrate-binding protein [Pseudomonas citronellolis]